jgi:SAM-dependent methyltransferase
LDTKCICGETETRFFGEKNGGTVVTCVSCGLIRRVDYDDTYTALYTEGTFYHDELQKQVGHEPYADRFLHDYDVGRLRILALLGRYRVLDVGCANGAFLAAAKDLGFQVEGLELNPVMAQTVRDNFAIRVHEAWDTVRGGFDVLTYHDVIEHVIDPQAEIDRAASFLLPGGLLILDTPDADHEAFQRLGMAWHHMRPEQHLWFFRASDLERLAILAGLEVQHVDRPIPGKIVVYLRKSA